MKYYNDFGYLCDEKENGKVTVTGVIKFDGEEEIISVIVDACKINDVNFSVMVAEYLKTRYQFFAKQ